MLKIGSDGIGDMYLGSDKIVKAYQGSDLVYNKNVAPILPLGYTQLDYIENATNGILTDIATIGSTWVVDVQMATTPSSSNFIICSDENAGHWFAARTSGKYAIGSTGYEFPQSVTTRSVFTISFTSKTISATCNGTTLTRTGTAEHSTYVSLFDDLNVNTTLKYKGKIFSVKCTSGGNFNGVPAQRDSDGIKGIYDTANDVFYPMSGLAQQSLPSGYTQIDYVDNTTYISTGISSVGSTWELDIQTPVKPGSGTRMIICSNDYAGHWFGVSSSLSYTIGGGNNFPQSFKTRNEFHVDFTSSTTISVSCGGTTLTRVGSAQNNSQVILFRDGVSASYLYKGRIFSVKCTSGGSFNGIPAQRTSDSKNGLYDLANDVFYPLT